MDRTVANELGHGLSSKLTASRKWRRFSTTSVEDHNAFRLMTWNILAPGNIDPAHYPGIERWALDWEHRRCVILDEIVAQNSDIIVLQEVGSLEFNSYLKPVSVQISSVGWYIELSGTLCVTYLFLHRN